MNVLIVCGGTGGHFFPGLAVGEELLKRQHQVLLIISEKEIDRKAIQHIQGFLIQTLPAMGWRGWRPYQLFQFCKKMVKAFIRSRQIFQNFKPDVIVGMGGFNSVAPLLLARLYRKPVCIHESNTIAGKANRFIASLGAVVAVGFEKTKAQFPKNKVVWTGTPVRSALRIKKARDQAFKELGLITSLPTVLIMGGSQGAKRLNQLVVDAATHVTSMDVQWLHLTGIEDEPKIRQAYAQAGKKAQVYAFYHEMERLYAAADLIIARAGAASLAEIAQWSLPSILIPFPFATEQHQAANASAFVMGKAAIMYEETDCRPEQLAKEIQFILIDKNHQKSMASAAQKLCREDAHQKLANLIERLKIDKDFSRI